MTSAEASGPTEERKCLNCAEPLRGGFCHACGQKAGAPPLHLHDFVHELVHEFLHFDSKILRTLRLLFFSPGTLTREYVSGRRASYVGPVRLFLVSSIVLFGLLALVPVDRSGPEPAKGAESFADADIGAPPIPEEGGAFARAVERGALKAMREPEHFGASFRGALSKSIFLLVPLFAFLTWKIFAKRQPHYVGHLYFALHLHAFGFFLLASSTALGLAGPMFAKVAFVFPLAALAYFYLAVRRVFEATWVRTLTGGTALLLVYAFINFAGITAVTLGTLFYL